MIHHFARALAIREQVVAAAPVQQSLFWPSVPSLTKRPEARPQSVTTQDAALVRVASTPARVGARVRRDPNDGRRALISGRFADVCAALDRLVSDTEPSGDLETA